MLCGFLLIGGNALLFVAERRVPIGLASLIFASVPLWLVVLRSSTGDRPPRASLVGTAVGFVGVALLLRPGRRCQRLGRAARRRGGALVGDRHVPLLEAADAGRRAHDGRRPGPHGRAAADPARAWRSSDGESHNPADWSTRSLLGLLYLVVFGSIFGYTAYVWLVANVPLGTVATYAYVNPLVAITLGILFLDEVITWQIAAGAAVILTSVAVVIRREVPRRPDAVIPPLVETLAATGVARARLHRPYRQISSGRTGTRCSGLPVAARIAATTAAVETTVGGSPTPLRP